MNCSVPPTVRLALAGETLIETTLAPVACTVSAADPLMPLREAVTVVDTESLPVANPPAETDAIDPELSAQVAVELTLAVDPSL